MNSKEFKAAQVSACGEIKNAVNNIFFSIKELKGLARKNEFCDGKSVTVVAKAVRDYTKGGNMFDVNAFFKDDLGRFCYRYSKIKNLDNNRKNCVLCGEIVTDTKGREIVMNDKKEFLAVVPVGVGIVAVFNAFCHVAAKELRAIELAERKAAKARETESDKVARRAERERNGRISGLSKRFLSGEISELEYFAAVKAIKAA